MHGAFEVLTGGDHRRSWLVSEDPADWPECSDLVWHVSGGETAAIMCSLLGYAFALLS